MIFVDFLFLLLIIHHTSINIYPCNVFDTDGESSQDVFFQRIANKGFSASLSQSKSIKFFQIGCKNLKANFPMFLFLRPTYTIVWVDLLVFLIYIALFVISSMIRWVTMNLLLLMPTNVFDSNKLHQDCNFLQHLSAFHFHYANQRGGIWQG